MSDNPISTPGASTGSLYIVATPIGNLGDISVRAMDILRTVDIIYAEDTRHSVRLLQHCRIQNTLKSLHEHNESARVDEVTNELLQGLSVAVISDAGTPLISDPGYRLVARCYELGIPVSPVPGASALIAALSASGLATDRFLFLGFLPSRATARTQWLVSATQYDFTVVMYESRHRIKDSLHALHDCVGAERVATVARELTKTYETIKRGSMAELCRWIEDPVQQKGEFVIMLDGIDAAVSVGDEELRRVLSILLPEMSVKRSAVCAAELTGCKRKLAYTIALGMRDEQ